MLPVVKQLVKKNYIRKAANCVITITWFSNYFAHLLFVGF
ncbi:hypothetical protein BH11BAC4_BH11BAC4_17580 [soil metagenome]